MGVAYVGTDATSLIQNNSLTNVWVQLISGCSLYMPSKHSRCLSLVSSQ